MPGGVVLFTPIYMILALETSSSLCAVCILDEASGAILAEISNDIGRGHAERLMDDISAALQGAGIGYADLTLIATGVGPGSFTGIRVGLAAARGLGLALEVPVLGVTSHQSVAIQVRDFAAGRNILVALDGGRDDIYCQMFDTDALPRGDPFTGSLAQLSDIPTVDASLICGSAAPLIDAAHLPTGAVLYHSPVQPIASAVASAAVHPVMTGPPRPLYLRAPDAKAQAGFAIARTGN